MARRVRRQVLRRGRTGDTLWDLVPGRRVVAGLAFHREVRGCSVRRRQVLVLVQLLVLVLGLVRDGVATCMGTWCSRMQRIQGVDRQPMHRSRLERRRGLRCRWVCQADQVLQVRLAVWRTGCTTRRRHRSRASIHQVGIQILSLTCARILMPLRGGTTRTRWTSRCERDATEKPRSGNSPETARLRQLLLQGQMPLARLMQPSARRLRIDTN